MIVWTVGIIIIYRRPRLWLKSRFLRLNTLAAEEQGFCSFGTEDDESGADEPLLLVFSPNTNVTNAFMADLKEMIAGGDASGQIGILGKACPFGGHRDGEHDLLPFSIS